MRDEICDAIRSVFSGTPYMSHETGVSFYNILSDVIKRKAAALQPHLLYNKNYCKHPFLISRIEFQVTSLIGGGFSNNEIADFLELRESTVRNYVSLILQKTGLEHRSQIAIYALNNGFASHQDLMRRYGPKIRRNMQLSVKTGIRPRRKNPSELYLPFSD
jgi:DNA-binding NarL/FixJ family response regulator